MLERAGENVTEACRVIQVKTKKKVAFRPARDTDSYHRTANWQKGENFLLQRFARAICFGGRIEKGKKSDTWRSAEEEWGETKQRLIFIIFQIRKEEVKAR